MKPEIAILLELLDTILKVSLGALIAGFISVRLESKKQKAEHLRCLEDRHQQQMREPIVRLMDDILALIDTAYWSARDGKIADVGYMVVIIRQKQAMIEARLSALADPAITDIFRDFIRAFVMFRQAIPDSKLEDAHKHMKEAIELAGKVIARVYPPEEN